MSPSAEEAERQDVGAKTPLPQILLPLEERATHFRDMLLERGVRGPHRGCLFGVGGELAIAPPGPRPLPHRAVDRLRAGHSGAKRHAKGPVLGGSEALGGAMRRRAVLATCPRMQLRGEQMWVSRRGRRMQRWLVSMAFLQEPSQLLTSSPPRDTPLR